MRETLGKITFLILLPRGDVKFEGKDWSLNFTLK